MEHKSKNIRLSLKNVSKSFFDKEKGNSLAVNNVSLDVYNNEFLVLLGPGRCGKSVLLNMITGLMEKDDGSIQLDGQEISGPNPAMGMVFQKLGLMPWLTVQQNVEFGLRMRGINPRERAKKAQHYINLVGLQGFEKSYPHQLSGGMKQRVGIARAYANDAKILVMDEPFGQLDAQTRYNMQDEIIRITQEDKRTILFVTNNIEEAVTVADRIILFTKYPATIKDIYEIKLPKPRDETSPEFLRIRKMISDNADLAL